MQKSRNKQVDHLIRKVIMSLIQRFIYRYGFSQEKNKRKIGKKCTEEVRLSKSITEEIRHQVFLLSMFRKYTLICHHELIGFVHEESKMSAQHGVDTVNPSLGALEKGHSEIHFNKQNNSPKYENQQPKKVNKEIDGRVVREILLKATFL